MSSIIFKAKIIFSTYAPYAKEKIKNIHLIPNPEKSRLFLISSDVDIF